jgi:O-glycosyl hydrolase
LFNIGDEPNVSIWNPRPAFYYMYYFQKMIGDRLLRTTTTANILAYASSFTSGEKGVILVNRSTDSQIVQVTLQNASVGNRFYWYTLTGGTDNGEFSGKVFVNGKGPDQPSGGPATSYTSLKAYSSSTQNGIKIGMPPRSVVYVVIDKQ